MHLLTSSLLLVADGAADCLELAAQRDDVVNWPVLTIVVRPVLEIARSLGVRPPARSRARRSSAPLRALRTRYDHRAGSDAYFDACPTHCWAFGAKHRLPTSDTSPPRTLNEAKRQCRLEKFHAKVAGVTLT